MPTDERVVIEWNKKLRLGIDQVRLAMADLRVNADRTSTLRKLQTAEKLLEAVEEQTSIAVLAV